MESHPNQAGSEIRLACVEWLLVVEPEEGLVVPSRGVGFAARDTGGRTERWCSDVPSPGARGGQGDPRGACVGADRGAECGRPCAADDAGDR